MVALVTASVFSRFIWEVLADERDCRFQEIAATVTHRVYTIVPTALALVVLMLRDRLPSPTGIAAETMAYSLCWWMLMHLVSSRYYSGKR